jgi:hypothetical protein
MGLSEPVIVKPREGLIDPRAGKVAPADDPFFSGLSGELAEMAPASSASSVSSYSTALVRSRSASSNCICVRNRSMAALSKLA